MYLSLLSLNRSQAKSLNIKDTYSLHRIVYDCFEKTRQDMQDSSGILFTEIEGSALEKRILILSRKEPIPFYSCQLQTKEIAESFFEKSHYKFEIIINPVIRENSSRKLIPMRSREDIIKWFCSRTEQWGFKVQAEYIDVINIYVDSFKKNNQVLTLGKAKIRGLLQVHNKEVFKNSFSLGLGKGKAFGCGLLQLTPNF